MRLFILLSLLILPSANTVAQTQQQSATAAITNQRGDAARRIRMPKSAVEARLSQVCGLWAEYWRQKKLDEVTALYAPNASFLTGSGDRISGRSAIRALFKTAMAGHTSDLIPRSLATEVSGNLAYDSGDYLETITTSTGVTKKELKGNYVIIFRRQRNGRWLIVQHVWTDKPAQ
jgi:uncharacterized protein (TIGR02246 family)